MTGKSLGQTRHGLWFRLRKTHKPRNGQLEVFLSYLCVSGPQSNVCDSWERRCFPESPRFLWAKHSNSKKACIKFWSLAWSTICEKNPGLKRNFQNFPGATLRNRFVGFYAHPSSKWKSCDRFPTSSWWSIDTKSRQVSTENKSFPIWSDKRVLESFYCRGKKLNPADESLRITWRSDPMSGPCATADAPARSGRSVSRTGWMPAARGPSQTFVKPPNSWAPQNITRKSLMHQS